MRRRFGALPGRRKKLAAAVWVWLEPSVQHLDGDLFGFPFADEIEWPHNPADNLAPGWREIIRLWVACGGLEPAHLPEAGGVLDQGAWLADAFDFISRWVADHRSRAIKCRPRGSRGSAR